MLPRVQWSDYRQYQKTLNLLKLMDNLVAGARNQLCRLFSANGLAVSYPSNKSGFTGV
jgi:hypothetical protein